MARPVTPFNTAVVVLAALGATMLPGCVSMNARWDACEKSAATFVKVADCTIGAVNSEAARTSQPGLRLRSEARAKSYARRAEDLVEQVATGRLADADARVVLRQALDQLLDEERDERLTPLRRSQGSGVTCSPVGNSVSCTPN